MDITNAYGERLQQQQLGVQSTVRGKKPPFPNLLLYFSIFPSHDWGGLLLPKLLYPLHYSDTPYLPFYFNDIFHTTSQGVSLSPSRIPLPLQFLPIQTLINFLTSHYIQPCYSKSNPLLIYPNKNTA